MYTLRAGANLKLKSAIVGIILGLSTTTVPQVLAEEVKIPLGQQGEYWNVERPRTGTSKAAVEMQFGAPLSTTGPVGDPPITTWEYESFNVYFEYDHVIHSVVKHKPTSD